MALDLAYAFVFYGNRGHMRVFCHLERIFQDFLLPHILKTPATAEAEAPPQDDAVWNEIITLSLTPNRKLPPKAGEGRRRTRLVKPAALFVFLP